MTTQIDLVQVFTAIVAHYDSDVAPRLIGSTIDKDYPDGLVRVRLGENRPTLIDYRSDLTASHKQATIGALEVHALRTALMYVTDFFNPEFDSDFRNDPDFPVVCRTDTRYAQAEEKYGAPFRVLSPYMAQLAAAIRAKEAFHALTPYLAIAGFREVARQCDLKDISWPDLTGLEQKMGMAPL